MKRQNFYDSFSELRFFDRFGFGDRSNTARKMPGVSSDERHNDDDRGIVMDDSKISIGV
jgi:hypothetical protein